MRVLPIDQAAQQSSTAAWCVDYVVLRRNQGRMTSGMIYWANIAKAMIVAKASAGQFEFIECGGLPDGAVGVDYLVMGMVCIHPAHPASYHGRILLQTLVKEANTMSFMPTPVVSADAQLRQSSIINQVYAWMTAGLLVTGAVAAYTANSPQLLQLIFGNPFGIWVLFIAQIAMVLGLSAGIGRLRLPRPPGFLLPTRP